MKSLAPYRDPVRVRAAVAELASICTRPHNIMEVCGGQTHSIVRFGIDSMLPEGVNLVHGPGCPVCVTPVAHIDMAIELALRPDVIFCSFGDMLRVPGTQKDLRIARSEGADVRVVYSPTDAVSIAEQHPDKEVVFFAIGFETTAPANAMAVYLARQRALRNFSVMVSHVLVPPAIDALLSAPDNLVQGFLAAGHVCAVMGIEEYQPLADRYRVPIVATGFEPLDILKGLCLVVRQLEEGRAEVEIAYGRAVRPGGNPHARKMMDEVFSVCDREWRGIGTIPRSGMELGEAYAEFDAVRRFGITPSPDSQEPTTCRAGDVLRGVLRPTDCPEFGVGCHPDNPLGAPMVSNEGACAAYFRYRRTSASEER